MADWPSGAGAKPRVLLLFLPFLEGKKELYTSFIVFNLKHRKHNNQTSTCLPVTALQSCALFLSLFCCFHILPALRPSLSWTAALSSRELSIYVAPPQTHCPLPLNKAQHTSHAFLLQCSSLAPALSAPEHTVCSSGNICLNGWHLTPAVDPDAYIIYRTQPVSVWTGVSISTFGSLHPC